MSNSYKKKIIVAILSACMVLSETFVSYAEEPDKIEIVEFENLLLDEKNDINEETLSYEITEVLEESSLEDDINGVEDIVSDDESIAVSEVTDDDISIVGEPVCSDENVTILVNNGTSSDKTYTVPYKTMEEIDRYFSETPASKGDGVSYAQKPNPKSGVAGSLSDSTQQRALNMVNRIRFVAGVAPVSINSTYSDLAQHASLLNFLNGGLSHYPKRPAGVSDEVYSKGYTGASKSNLAATGGYSATYNQMTIEQWMGDSDSSNIDRLGHRRWVICPTAKEFGFGYISGEGSTYSAYGAMYVIDSSNIWDSTDISCVAWPAQNMPTNLIDSGDAWSFSVSTYLEDASVKVVRRSDGRTWSFTKGKSDGYFNISNDAYGVFPCIIFRPNGISGYNDGDIYDVTVNLNNSESISYTVNFFKAGARKSLSDAEKEKLKNDVGELNAIVFADSESTLNSVKLPSGWSWKDKNNKIYANSAEKSKEFTAVYNKAGYYSFEAQLKVNISQIDAVKIVGPSEIKAGETYNYTIEYITTGADIAPGSLKPVYNWNVSDNIFPGNLNGADIEIMPDYSDKDTSGTINLSVTIDGHTFSAPELKLKIAKGELVDYRPDINKAEVKLSGKTVYTSYGITPNVTVKYPYIENGKNKYVNLVRGQDYLVSYSDNVNAGTAQITITGIGEYSGKLQIPFTITQKSIAGVTIQNYGDIKYGEEPKIVVKDGVSVLRQGIDYELSYDKGSASQITTSVVTITPLTSGNYTGVCKKSVKLNILPENTEAVSISGAKVELTAPDKVYTYTAGEIKPSVKVTLNGVKVNSSQYKVIYYDNVNAGTASLKVVGVSKNGKGYYGDTEPITFNINPKPISKVKVSGTNSIPLNINAKNIDFIVKDGKATLVKGVDYDIDLSNVFDGSGKLLSTVKTGKAYEVKVIALNNKNYISDSFKTVTVKFSKLKLNSKTANVTVKINNPSNSAVTVKYNGTLLQQEVDYKAKVTLNKKTGLYDVSLSAKGDKYVGTRKVTGIK